MWRLNENLLIVLKAVQIKMLRIQYMFKIIFFIFFTCVFFPTKIYCQQPKKIKTIIRDDVIEFPTEKGNVYVLEAKK